MLGLEGMRIAEHGIRRSRDATEVSASVDGFRLWYRIPAPFAVSATADPFAAAALLPAMLQGEGLSIDPGMPLSPRLLQNLGTLQEIHHAWNPVFRIVPLEAATAPSPALGEGVMAFYSGGVDSSFTFLKRREELTHLVFIQGFDFFANASGAGPFSADDLADLSQLAFKLTRPKGGLARFLRSALSPSLLAELAAVSAAPGRVAAGLETRLAAEIESLLAGPPIWDRRRFAGVPLRAATTELLGSAAETGDAPRLNRLLLEDGFPREIARRRDAGYRTAVERNGRFARQSGKTLIPVSTNHYAFGYRYNLSRNLTQGSALASVALLLGFRKAYVPAAYAYDQLIPLGSHPLTDPLYSNETLAIVHDGAEARRLDKVAAIARDPAALANLRVCFDDMNDNCGRCAKCLRTMIPLARLGAVGAPFPSLPPLRAIRRMHIADAIERIFLAENLDPGTGAGDESLDRALRACLRRFGRRELLKTADAVLLGGALRKARLRRASRTAGITRIDSSPPR